MPKLNLLGKSRVTLDFERNRLRKIADTIHVKGYDRLNPNRLGRVFSKSVAWEKLESAAFSMARALEVHPALPIDKERLKQLHQFLENAIYDKA